MFFWQASSSPDDLEKDTAGPVLNPMIKVVKLVSLIAAPIIVTYANASGFTLYAIWGVAILMLAVVGWAISRSKAPARPLDE